MSMLPTREEMLSRLLDAYAGYFDIEEKDGEPDGLRAECAFHVNNSKYVLTKKAILWEANCHEYIWIFSAPHITAEMYDRCEKLVYDRGMEKIEPKKGHMYTYLTAVFLCDSCDAEVVKKVKKCRLYKSFRFSLDGWMDFHTALVSREGDGIFANRSGRENAKFLKKVLRPSSQKGTVRS